jgi:hypothetical protein
MPSLAFLCPIFTTYGATALATTKMPKSKLREYNSCRHSFPHVPQHLFPMTRPDGFPGQYFHLTQLPYGIDIDPTTGLARSYQFVIHFDLGYNDMKKTNVQEAARARFDAMGIALHNASESLSLPSCTSKPKVGLVSSR